MITPVGNAIQDLLFQVEKLCHAGGREMSLQGQGTQSAATRKLGHEEARACPSSRRQDVSVQRLRSQVTGGQEERMVMSSPLRNHSKRFSKTTPSRHHYSRRTSGHSGLAAKWEVLRDLQEETSSRC